MLKHRQRLRVSEADLAWKTISIFFMENYHRMTTIVFDAEWSSRTQIKPLSTENSFQIYWLQTSKYNGVVKQNNENRYKIYLKQTNKKLHKNSERSYKHRWKQTSKQIYDPST